MTPPFHLRPRVHARSTVRAVLAALAVLLALGASNLVVFASGNPATQTHVTVGSSTKACLQPPANVDLTTLSDDQLANYGLLPHPQQTDRLAKWREVIRHSLHHYCGPDVHTDLHASRINDGAWSGNVATGGGYTDVQANWHVPCVLATTKPANSVQWVGLAGAQQGGNLLQVGTLQNISSTGSAVYYAWWSDLGDPSYQNVTKLYNVGCQDYVFGEASSTTVYLDDYTNNTYVSRSDTAHPAGNQTAEWIVEREGSLLTYPPLANFSPYEATFYYTEADQNGVVKNVGHTTHDSVYMCSLDLFHNPSCGAGSDLLANPTAISSDGATFGVHWDAST